MSTLARRVREPSANSPALHACKHIEVFFHRAIARGRVFSRLGQRAAILPHSLRIQIANVRLACLDQLHCPIAKLIEVVGREKQAVFPVGTQPADIVDNRVDVFLFFFGWVGVVEPQIELAAKLARQARI